MVTETENTANNELKERNRQSSMDGGNIIN